MPFAALMYLRKLCNHPDLATGGPNKYGDLDLNDKPELEYGAYQRSGKMIVLQTLLHLWFEQGQKVLLFSQSRQMLTIIEKFIILQGLISFKNAIKIHLFSVMNIYGWMEQRQLEEGKIWLLVSMK